MTRREVPRLRIDEVAQRTGLTKRAIRYYEEMGLLSPPPRSRGGFRQYTAADVARLNHIREIKELTGVPLPAIKDILDLEDRVAILRNQGHYTEEDLLDIESRLVEVLRRVEDRIRLLSAYQQQLQARLARVRSCLARRPPEKGSGSPGAPAAGVVSKTGGRRPKA